MKKKLLSIMTLALAVCSGAWATEETVTLSGATTKGSASDVMGPSSITSSSANITTGAVGSSCTATGYHLTTKDGKYCTYGGTTYYLMHTYNSSNSKASWNDAGLTNQYGTFTIPSGYTFKITKVTHAMASQSATFTAAIIVKDAANASKYTSSNITVPSVSDGAAASDTDISLTEANQVTLSAGTYTLNVNISSTVTNTGKYAGIAQVVLTGDLATAAIDTNSPSITTDLDDENAYTAYLGIETTLSIEADHVTSYQWYSNTTASTSGGTAIDGATSFVYKFTPDAVGNLYFYCVATNSNATNTQTATSKIATVNVQAQTPEFSLSATDIIIGGTAQIRVGSKANLDGLTMAGLTYDNSIVSITDEGVVTGLAKGTTTIKFTTAASGNYAASGGTVSLSISVTGKVVATSTPDSWTGTTSRTWSVTKITFSGQGEGGDNGLYFTTGTKNSINYTSGTYFSLKDGNTMYLEVPSATSAGTVKIVATQDNERYLVVTNSEGDQKLKMSTSGNTVSFDANSIEEIDGSYYIKIAQGSGECKLAITNFATVTISSTISLNASGYATYSAANDFSVSGAKAYTATLANEKITCSEIASAKVPAGNGVILFGKPGATVTLTPTTEAAALSGNDLMATTLANGTTATKGDGTYYALSGNAFKTFTGNAFVANKAYFEAPSGAGIRTLAITFEDSEAMGIDGAVVDVTKAVKGIFDLQGRRVENPVKGIYIVDGKMVVIK